jgi:hypothetical protein
MLNKIDSNKIELPECIVKKIISYVDDLNFYQCHTCIKRISCIDNCIKYGHYKFCSDLCLRCC